MNALILAVALAAQATPQSPSPPAIGGTWQSPGGNSIISIAPCGSMTFCGTVAWASERARKDAAKTTPQLVGTQLLTNVRQDSRGRWHGKLFIPDKNMRVTAKLEPIGQRQLKVSGCAAGKSLCRSTIWSRFDGPLPPSD